MPVTEQTINLLRQLKTRILDNDDVIVYEDGRYPTTAVMDDHGGNGDLVYHVVNADDEMNKNLAGYIVYAGIKLDILDTDKYWWDSAYRAAGDLLELTDLTYFDGYEWSVAHFRAAVDIVLESGEWPDITDTIELSEDYE